MAKFSNLVKNMRPLVKFMMVDHAESILQSQCPWRFANILGTQNSPHTLNSKNQLLVTDKLVEFEKYLVDFQDFSKITDLFEGIYGINIQLINETERSQQSNWLDLETLGSWPTMAKNLPGHSPQMFCFHQLIVETIMTTTLHANCPQISNFYK